MAYTKARVGQILRMYRDGESVSAIARKLGGDRNSINRHIQQAIANNDPRVQLNPADRTGEFMSDTGGDSGAGSQPEPRPQQDADGLDTPLGAEPAANDAGAGQPHEAAAGNMHIVPPQSEGSGSEPAAGQDGEDEDEDDESNANGNVSVEDEDEWSAFAGQWMRATPGADGGDGGDGPNLPPIDIGSIQPGSLLAGDEFAFIEAGIIVPIDIVAIWNAYRHRGGPLAEMSLGRWIIESVRAHYDDCLGLTLVPVITKAPRHVLEEQLEALGATGTGGSG